MMRLAIFASVVAAIFAQSGYGVPASPPMPANPTSSWGAAPVPQEPPHLEPKPVMGSWEAPDKTMDVPVTFIPKAEPIQKLLTYTLDTPTLQELANYNPSNNPIQMWATYRLQSQPMTTTIDVLPSASTWLNTPKIIPQQPAFQAWGQQSVQPSFQPSFQPSQPSISYGGMMQSSPPMDQHIQPLPMSQPPMMQQQPQTIQMSQPTFQQQPPMMQQQQPQMTQMSQPTFQQQPPMMQQQPQMTQMSQPTFQQQPPMFQQQPQFQPQQPPMQPQGSHPVNFPKPLNTPTAAPADHVDGHFH